MSCAAVAVPLAAGAGVRAPRRWPPVLEFFYDADGSAAGEQLVEMLSWKGAAERGARRVVSTPGNKRPNALRVARVPGSPECVSYAADEESNLHSLWMNKEAGARTRRTSAARLASGNTRGLRTNRHARRLRSARSR